MKFWSRFPVFRVLIPFSAGMICEFYIHPNLFKITIWTSLFLIFSFLFTIKNLATGRYATRWLAGIPFYTMFFLLGILVHGFSQPGIFRKALPDLNQKTFLFGYINEPPKLTLRGYRIQLTIQACELKDKRIASRAKVLLYLNDTNGEFRGMTGDNMVIYALPRRIRPPANPDAFDFAGYMALRGVQYQCTISKNQFVLFPCSSFNLTAYSNKIRNVMLNKIKRHIQDPDRLGVAGALLLGYGDGLDPDLRGEYSIAGVLHVLCVSGMHVGLIYLVLSSLLGWMDKNRLLRNLRFVMLLVLIWIYAAITGLSPSVVRASTMITIVILGQWINRTSHIYNILSASSLLIFIFNPMILHHAGFQLSFLAVCGIVFFHRGILSLWTAPSGVLQKIWEIVSVSLAAQAATFPLSIYLFHQFPNYFILGNLLVIPLTTIVMYSGISVLLIGNIPLMGELAGFIFSNSIGLVNLITHFISDLPGALTENISLSLGQTLLIYLLLILLLAWLSFRHAGWLILVLMTGAALQLTWIGINGQNNRRVEFVVYQVKNESVYSFINGRTSLLFSQLPADSSQQLHPALRPHFTKRKIREYKIVHITEGTARLIHGYDIFIFHSWNGAVSDLKTGTTTPCRYLVIGGNIPSNLGSLVHFLQPQCVIFDSSCKLYKAQNAEEELRKLGVRTHVISNEGAFVVNL